MYYYFLHYFLKVFQYIYEFWSIFTSLIFCVKISTDIFWYSHKIKLSIYLSKQYFHPWSHDNDILCSSCCSKNNPHNELLVLLNDGLPNSTHEWDILELLWPSWPHEVNSHVLKVHDRSHEVNEFIFPILYI